MHGHDGVLIPPHSLTVRTREARFTSSLRSRKTFRSKPQRYGIFHGAMSQDADYPSQVTFTTKIYHPGINDEGSICVPILRDQVGRLPHVNAQLDRRELLQWKPSITLATGEKLRGCAPDAECSYVSS